MNDTQQKCGTVYLVGAGPGHPGLITKLGYDILHSCDAVVYDDLIPYDLVAALDDNIEKHYVGKRGGRYSISQDEINEILVGIARRGLDVIRLKGGDPLIFGRGGEEASYLKKEGIPFVMVPGVSAVNAVASGTGIPLTDRRYASWLMLATGHEAKSASAPVPWEEVGKLSGGTIAIYMGMGELSRIINDLMAGGTDINTPAAVIQNGYLGSQRAVLSTISELPALVVKQGLKPPAIILIGQAVGLYSQTSWRNEGALTGKRVLITRPLEHSPEFCEKLRSLGAEPIPLPTIKTQCLEEVDGWNEFKLMTADGGWIVFTSAVGVKMFIEKLWQDKLDLRCLGKFKIAVIGKGTVSELRKHRLLSDLVPETATVSELAQTLVNRIDLNCLNVVRVRGNLGDRTIEETVVKAGAKCLPLHVYSTLTNEWEDRWKSAIADNPPDYIVFTSGSTVEGFIENLGLEKAKQITESSKVISIGPATSEVIRNYGIKVCLTSPKHDVDGIIEAIKEQNLPH